MPALHHPPRIPLLHLLLQRRCRLLAGRQLDLQPVRPPLLLIGATICQLQLQFGGVQVY
jgi:hypothetical protein